MSIFTHVHEIHQTRQPNATKRVGKQKIYSGALDAGRAHLRPLFNKDSQHK